MTRKTSQKRCRQKNTYGTETRALQALRDMHKREPGQRSERMAYPCKSLGEPHWHLTSWTPKAEGQVGGYITMLERTVVFLLREIERRDRG